VAGVGQGALLAGQAGLFQFFPVGKQHIASSLIQNSTARASSIPHFLRWAKTFQREKIRRKFYSELFLSLYSGSPAKENSWGVQDMGGDAESIPDILRERGKISGGKTE
jgi:hypothetical protein